MRIPIQDFRRGLSDREQRRADIDHAQYVRPLGSSGLHVVEWPIGSSTEITVGSALQGQTFQPGTVVPLASHIGDTRKIIVGGPPAGFRGASAFPVDIGGPGDLTSIGIISASPTTIESGSSAEPVTLTGFGFTSSHTFEAVRMSSSGWAVDPLIVVATVSVDDSETAQVTVSVDSSTPAGYSISFRVVDTPHVGVDLMSVTEGAATKSYLALSSNGVDTLHAMLYNDGAYDSQITTVSYSSLSATPSLADARRVPSLGDVVVFRAGSKLATWNIDTNTLTSYNTTAVVSVLGGWFVLGTTIYFCESGFNIPQNLYSVSVGSTGPATLVATLDDPGDGDFWLVGPQPLVVGSEIWNIAWDLDTDDYWWSVFDTATTKYVLLGSGTGNDEEFIAFNRGSPWTFDGDGLSYMVGGPGEGSGEARIIRIQPDGSWSYVLPSGWDVNGASAFPSVVGNECVIYKVKPSAQVEPANQYVRFSLVSVPSSPTLTEVEVYPVLGSIPGAFLPRS